METYIVILIGILFIAVIGFFSYYFNYKTIILRRLNKLPHSRISSLKTNSFSKIEGKALSVKEPLIAPLSKRKCVFYKVIIERKVNNGKSSHWKTIINEEKIQDFFVEQHNERVVVFPVNSPKNYTAYLVTDTKVDSGMFNKPTLEFKKLLESYNIKSTDFLGFNKTLRYKEAIIEVGERITVAGNVNYMKLENPIADYSYSSIIAINAKGKDKIMITDLPKALKPKHGRV